MSGLPPPLPIAPTVRNATFRPVADTVSISVTTSSQDAAISPTYYTNYASFSQVEIYNDCGSPVFMVVGSGAQTAAVATSRPVPSKAWVIMDWDPRWTDVAVIGAAGISGSIYFTPGIGC